MIEILPQSVHFCQKLLHQVKPAQTLEDICRIYKTTMFYIKKNNPDIEQVEAGDCLIIDERDLNFYVVKPTDTLQKIAQKNNTTEEELINKNGCNAVFIGQLLII